MRRRQSRLRLSSPNLPTGREKFEHEGQTPDLKVLVILGPGPAPQPAGQRHRPVPGIRVRPPSSFARAWSRFAGLAAGNPRSESESASDRRRDVSLDSNFQAQSASKAVSLTGSAEPWHEPRRPTNSGENLAVFFLRVRFRQHTLDTMRLHVALRFGFCGHRKLENQAFKFSVRRRRTQAGSLRA